MNGNLVPIASKQRCSFAVPGIQRDILLIRIGLLTDQLQQKTVSTTTTTLLAKDTTHTAGHTTYARNA